MELRKMAERIFGSKVEDAEYAEAKTEATKKLVRIDEQEGTKHGSEYLAMLIAEYLQISRLSDMLERIDREIRKKVEPASANASQSRTQQRYFITV